MPPPPPSPRRVFALLDNGLGGLDLEVAGVAVFAQDALNGHAQFGAHGLAGSSRSITCPSRWPPVRG